MDRISLVETFSDRCSLYRYRVPVEIVAETVAHEGSRYSPEFEIGGVQWRLHLQHRTAPQSHEVYLAVHLQCVSAKGAYGHFKIAICNRDPSLNKAKTFHCHFKKAGSAWGLHHFVALDTLLSPERGYLDDGSWGGDARRSIPSPGSHRYVVIDVIVNVLEPGMDGSYSLGSLPQPSHASAVLPAVANRARYEQSAPRSISSASRGGPLSAFGGVSAYPGASLNSHNQHQPPSPSMVDPLSAAHIKATLVYPFEHLEALCDMWFDVQGVRINAHRCVVAARMGPLLPSETLPLKEGCTVSMQAPMEVFAAFLKYCYTEEYPEAGVLRADALLDLYLLASQCEYYDLCGVCLRLARPLLHAENILPIVLTRYNAADETLTAMYVRVLLDHYDALIADKQFEDIPGHLFRRLSLILRDKEKLPPIAIPAIKHTMGRQLAALAESGDYSDIELPVNAGLTLRAHKFILASRSVVFSQSFHIPKNAGASAAPALPSFQGAEYQFSSRAWAKGLANIYRRHLETPKELSAEDITLVYKLNGALVMDGHLKREADAAVTGANALRVLIYAVKHNVPELQDRSMALVSPGFPMLIRQDPAAWDLISELPQPTIVTLFRMVTEASEGR